jgi:hypothetical protein
MLALVEARANAAGLRDDISLLERHLERANESAEWQCNARCEAESREMKFLRALDDEKAEAARWKRAADVYAMRCITGGCPTYAQETACNWTGPMEKCRACWNAWALGEEKP